jgi:hypothetical protein
VCVCVCVCVRVRACERVCVCARARARGVSGNHIAWKLVYERVGAVCVRVQVCAA